MPYPTDNRDRDGANYEPGGIRADVPDKMTARDFANLQSYVTGETAVNFHTILIELINKGYFFKLGMSLRGDGFLLSIGKQGQRMDYQTYKTPEELENLVAFLQSLP